MKDIRHLCKLKKENEAIKDRVIWEWRKRKLLQSSKSR